MKRLAVLLSILFFSGQVGFSQSQSIPQETKDALSHGLDSMLRQGLAIGRISLDSVIVSPKSKQLQLYANYNCSYVPFRPEIVDGTYQLIRSLLPQAYREYRTTLYTGGRAIEDLIPLLYKTKKEQRGYKTFAHKRATPLISRLSAPNKPEAGLQDKHIALWQSHGYYYEPKLARWEWQRARIFQTVEDLYTQAYVLPFLVPMLENAGATVLIPRERDSQRNEVIVDNDRGWDNQAYTEQTGDKPWQTGDEPGFARLRETYKDFENPFREGTFRRALSIRKGEESKAEWIPDIPEAGSYAVYISYKTVDKSTEDALYTVYHKGGSSQFRVNQKMGGGTWVYLGHFDFDKGKSQTGKVVLSNHSSKAGRIVTADAVKFGGGYGTIARRVASGNLVSGNVKSSDSETGQEIRKMPEVDYPYERSGYPRFTEAARYWMQWAGIPDSIYSDSQGINDYTDDYKSRGKWVNYISGGSSANPGQAGLNIPVDMALAFHTDAGTTWNDSIIGTLGIFCTVPNEGVFANGTSRYASRDLTDLIQTTIVEDIRALYEPEWSRRGMWNRPYFETIRPQVPTMLLELLSHQNFADMRYGLDPGFRFSVSRSIYKGILKFIASQYKQDYIVQPLPVDHMSLRFVSDNEAELTWQPVDDPLEPTAKAEQYIVYTRIGDSGFDNGTLVAKNHFRVRQMPGICYSYKVTAVNRGGESFPSEILSAGKVLDEKGTVLVVNGFDRISGPADFATDSIAGFLDQTDHGVPYLKDISYIGSMTEFRKSIPWMDDDAPGFGASRANYETMVIAGNTFDYPAVHGASLMKAGYSFVSCSDEAVEKGEVKLGDYKLTDWIAGKECKTKIGRGGVHPRKFSVFSPGSRKAITDYCHEGGNIFISGAYVGTDIWDNGTADEEEIAFATNILKYKWRTNLAAISGTFKSVASPFRYFSGTYDWYNELNEESYVVESPDGIEPASTDGYTIFRYSENNLSAGVAYKGVYRTCVLGIPFEAVKCQDARDRLMCSVLDFFEERFRFAFLTDLHISGNPTSVEDLERAVEQINRTEGIAFVIIGGDVTEEGDRASLQIAKDILSRLKVPYYAVSGNHETKWSASGVTAFADVFGGERFRFEYGNFLFLGFNSGPLMRMADGHVAPQDITWIKKELESRGKEQPVIIVTHYPLKDGDVDNWYEVTDAMRPYNIRAVLGGHYHNDSTFLYDGIPGILNRSVLRAKEEKGGYSLYEVTADSILVYEHRIGEEPVRWTSLPLKEKLFDSKGDPDKYPDFSVNKAFPEVERAWFAETGTGIYCSPAVEGNRVFTGDDMGRLTAYDLNTGSPLWCFESGRRIVGTPAVSAGVVVFGSADTYIYGLDSRSGKERWRIKAGEPVLGAVSIADGVAFVGSGSGAFRAIDIHRGTVKWVYDKVKGYIETKPLLTERLVIFGAWDNTLYALDKANGQEVWKWTGGLTRMHFSPAAVWPVAAEGKVFITDPQRAMTAIDIRNGETVWRTFGSMVRETIGLSEDKKRVYSKTMNDSIVCFSTQGNMPRQVWATNVGFGYEHAPSMPVEKDKVVFGSTKGGLIFALDAFTGEVLWKHKVGNSLVNTVVPLNRGKLLFTTTEGYAGLLNIKNTNSK